MGTTHTTAFSMLEYGVISQSGFTVITGEVGSGKTTIVKHLLGQLHGRIKVGLINNTHNHMGQLLPWVLHSFNQPYNDESPIALYHNFEQFLENQTRSGERTVLIIDEAQNLGMPLLEELRMLSNIDTVEPGLQIILIGQPQLRDLLMQPELMQFSQRVAADYHIAALSLKETIAYMKHRLTRVGSAKPIFDLGAYRLIFAASRGIPRLVNVVCDTALSFAFGDGVYFIDEQYMHGVLKERAEGGLLALGQKPSRQFGKSAYESPNLDTLLKKTADDTSID